MAVYHILMTHFPVALWLTACLFMSCRMFSDSEPALRLQGAVRSLAIGHAGRRGHG